MLLFKLSEVKCTATVFKSSALLYITHFIFVTKTERFLLFEKRQFFIVAII